jgi:alcohol dehydrogenase class IV
MFAPWLHNPPAGHGPRQREANIAIWTYAQPTEITFGLGSRHRLPDTASRFGRRCVLVTDRALAELPMAAEALAALGPEAILFSEVEPNPQVATVDRLADLLREHEAQVAVALGGGSSLDCAKAACSVAAQGGPIRRYHSGGEKLGPAHLPLIAMPTTAGTGSEVTPIAVLDDPEQGLKAPLAHPNFFPKSALVDPELTLTLPRLVTAATGLDALAHALEGYWSKNHQPICDVLAKEAARLAFAHLPVALDAPGDVAAREGMSQAALLGGMAFQLPKNAAVHACSFPLSSDYHLPHGTACAMTLDLFARYNAPALGVRGTALAQAAGFSDMDAMAEAIAALKAQSGLPTRLSEAGITESDLDRLVADSFHPLMDNNPRPVSAAGLRELYGSIL